MAANSEEILHDFSPMLRHYKDGRIERLTGQEFVPPSLDRKTGVQSKDVQIAPEINVAARLYLPGKADPTKKLPLLVYYHGGGFVVESAFSPLYHNHLNFLVAEANVVAVSVNYRLAPEHPLPAAYDDSWLALKYVASQSTDEGQESWIKEYADLGRVYLGGDSAGANIAHNMGLRASTEKLEGIKLCGIFLNCPYFGGKDPIAGEVTDAVIKAFMDTLWLYAWPTVSGCDDPRINPAMHTELASLGCGKVLVFVSENDPLKDRGWYYKETLEKCGWKGDVEVVEAKGQMHVFSVFNPECEEGMAVLKKISAFINH